MAVLMAELGIDRLPAQDRMSLADEIRDSLTADVEGAPLPVAWQHEIDRRLAAHRANPDAAIPWEQVEAEALARLRT